MRYDQQHDWRILWAALRTYDWLWLVVAAVFFAAAIIVTVNR